MKKTSTLRHLLTVLTLLTVGLALGLRPAQAQEYIFSVPDTRMQVYLQPDGSAHVVYDITFQNSYGDPLDVFDIGMPNDNWNLGSVDATLDGNAANNIEVSTYVNNAVAVYFDNSIDRGDQGVLHVEFDVEELVYQDVTRQGYASMQITPTWFDSDLVTSGGTLNIAIYMLPGITPDEILQQNVAFSNKALFQERAVAIFTKDDWSATGAYRVGVSFPDRGMTNVIQQNVLDLTNMWLEQNPGVVFFVTAASLALMALAFFRFSGGTGIVVFVGLAAAVGCGAFLIPFTALLTLPLAIAAVIFVEVSLARRKKQYLPPIAQVEGGGIKRGLTAPEAAVILEEPLGKIVTLVIFGLLRKGVLTQVPGDRLTVKVDPDFAGLKKSRLEAAQKKGIVLHDYEHGFLSALQSGAGEQGMLVEKADFSGAIKELIDGAVKRMAGFDLSDTQAYYKGIIRRALTEAAAIGDVKVREKQVDTDLEWILLDKNYPTVFNRPGWTYRPMWVRPWFTGGTPLTTSTSGGTGNIGGSRPSSSGGGGINFGDVAGGFAGWAENTMGGLASTILPGSLSVPTRGGGFTDLSGFDKVTGDIFDAIGKAAAESSKGGGGGGRSGGGSSCACACAGCACACACAGGGR